MIAPTPQEQRSHCKKYLWIYSVVVALALNMVPLIYFAVNYKLYSRDLKYETKIDNNINLQCGFGYFVNDTCICYDEYSYLKFSKETSYCIYERKRQLIAMIIDGAWTFGIFGAGRLYIGNSLGIIQLICMLAYTLLASLCLCAKARYEQERINKIKKKVIFGLILLGPFIWLFYDLYYFSQNAFVDRYGYSLLADYKNSY